MLTPQAKRKAVDFFVKEEHLSTGKACTLAGISRNSYQYKAKQKDDQEVQDALSTLTQKHAAIGF